MTDTIEYLPYEGDEDAPIVVVCDPPSVKNFNEEYTMNPGAMRLFADYAEKAGFDGDDFVFVSPCEPIPDRAKGSDARERDHLKSNFDAFMATMELFDPDCIITLGKHAIKQVSNRAVKIMKVRGQAQEYPTFPGVPVLPMISPAQVIRLPDNLDMFVTDMHMLRQLDENNYDLSAPVFSTEDVDYEWVFDLQFLIDKIESGEVRFMAVDCEATGLDWYRPEVYPICVQICYGVGKAVAVPLLPEYWNPKRAEYERATGKETKMLTPRIVTKLKNQLRQIMEDDRVHKAGHNAKIDHHYLGCVDVFPVRWSIDTMLLAFLVDENMPEKSLDECVRRWVPAMRGYADKFNAETDKSRMIDVALDPMLTYGCGDVDATYRLAKVLWPLVKQDEGQLTCYQKVMMPVMSAFMDTLEPEGMHVDTDQLAELQEALKNMERGEYQDLIKQVPRAVKRAHLNDPRFRNKAPADVLKFSRPDFVRDIIFGPDGFNLTPRVFTKSTQNLPDDEKVPSTSAKDHLPYFEDHPFVGQFMNYQRLSKMRGTYVGEAPSEANDYTPTGFWKYVHDGKIHPSFLLHRTVTGRSASANPNAQNFPKRGRGNMKEVVKAFRRVFVAPPGWKIIECDLSQIELRLVAWTARDRTMLDLYNNGADIHAMTAARTMGLDYGEFLELDDDTRDMKRFQAKAVNFGFIYGMWWRKFMVYAKTDYGLDYTEREAQHLRESFFNTYTGIEPWHNEAKDYAHEHGLIRALHGAARHLPNIWSPDQGVVKECERQAVNSPIQRFGSDLGLMALARLSRDAPSDLIRPIAFIHDALVCLVRDDYVDEGMAAVKFYMETNPLDEWFGLAPPLPILADASLGPNMADMEEIKGLEAWQPDWYQPWEDGRADDWDKSELVHMRQIYT